MTEQRLCDFTEGSVGIISKVTGSSSTTARLLEMGMVPGQHVRVIRAGNPSILEVGETRLCVRPGDLQGIVLSTIDSTVLHSAVGEEVDPTSTMVATN